MNSCGCYDRIVKALRELGDDETLLVQSGKAVECCQFKRD
jgi:urocanate hydratase